MEAIIAAIIGFLGVAAGWYVAHHLQRQAQTSQQRFEIIMYDMRALEEVRVRVLRLVNQVNALSIADHNTAAQRLEQYVEVSSKAAETFASIRHHLREESIVSLDSHLSPMAEVWADALEPNRKGTNLDDLVHHIVSLPEELLKAIDADLQYLRSRRASFE